MALVKCNHCRKETKNDTKKCKWCNKELDENLDTIHNKLIDIENKVKEERKLKEQKYIEDNFWICEQCQEENKLNIEVCWKCQNVDKQNNSQKIKKIHSNQEKDEEVQMLSMKIINELKPTTNIKRIIYMIGMFIWYIVFFGIISVLLELPTGMGPGFIEALIIFYPYHFLYKRLINIPLSRNYRRKAINKLGLDNHKYINEINDIVKNSSVGL